MDSKRQQAVRVNNVVSEYTEVTSGVPQGSVLGPLLFLLYINDLVEVCKYSTLKMFADDSKVYFKCRENSDFDKLFSDVESVFQWFESNQLKVAVEKCAILHLGNSNPCRQYDINDASTPSVSCMKDLGILVSSNMKFSDHCTDVAQKAFRASNLFFLGFKSRNKNFVRKYFTTYVRPLVENSTSVWNPYLQQDIDIVEKVQRKFTKRIPGLRHKSYGERLNDLSLDTLELRRLHKDVVLCYKIIHGLVDLDPQDFFTFSRRDGGRGHNQKLFVPQTRLDCRKRFFSSRVVNIWNSLPQDVISSPTLSLFKRRLADVDFSRFLKYD
jgi:hypothetical protein